MARIKMTKSTITSYIKRRGLDSFVITVLYNQLNDWINGLNTSSVNRAKILLCCRAIGDNNYKTAFIDSVVMDTYQDMTIRIRGAYSDSPKHTFSEICREYSECLISNTRAQKEKLLVYLYQNYGIWTHELTTPENFLPIDASKELEGFIHLEMDRIMMLCDRTEVTTLKTSMLQEAMINYLVICSRRIGKNGKILYRFE